MIPSRVPTIDWFTLEFRDTDALSAAKNPLRMADRVGAREILRD
jgi:hypothetical protein